MQWSESYEAYWLVDIGASLNGSLTDSRGWGFASILTKRITTGE